MIPNLKEQQINFASKIGTEQTEPLDGKNLNEFDRTNKNRCTIRLDVVDLNTIVISRKYNVCIINMKRLMQSSPTKDRRKHTNRHIQSQSNIINDSDVDVIVSHDFLRYFQNIVLCSMCSALLLNRYIYIYVTLPSPYFVRLKNNDF